MMDAGNGGACVILTSGAGHLFWSSLVWEKLMNVSFTAVVPAVCAYLVGSIPFGLLTAKAVTGVDVRQRGSGNIGATNVGRVVGAKWGVVVLLLDSLKGALSVWLLPLLWAVPTEAVFAHLSALCGIAAILGHMFPCWLGFRGGKGVATAMGVTLILAPWGTLTAVCIFLAVFAAFRIVALSSLLASVAFAVFQLVDMWPEFLSRQNVGLSVLSVCAPLLIIIRHQQNIARLIRGQEPRFQRAGNTFVVNSVSTVDANRDQVSGDV